MSTTIYSLVLVLPLLLSLLWHLSSSLAPPPPATLTNKRIILLIAHPDDESMFFSPTLQALTQPSLNNHLKILCLSTGNADGLGPTRVKELERAAVMLGLRKREDVFVMNDERRFQDGMKTKWDEKEISRVLASAFAPQLNTSSTVPPAPSSTTPSAKDEKERRKHRSKKSTSNSSTPSAHSPSPTPPAVIEAPRATIDVLLTFDAQGISSHPNHIALYHGARLFLSTLMRGYAGYACPVQLYTLTSINPVRKYTFILDVLPTYVSGILNTLFDTGTSSASRPKKGAAAGDKLVFINDIRRYITARSAMTTAHKSQMVWFRWGWISIGRYMVVNDLRRERIVASRAEYSKKT